MLSDVKDKLLNKFYNFSPETDSNYILIDILVVNERILSILKYDSDYYLCYNLQERKVQTTDNKIALIKELLTCCLGSEINISNLESFLNGNLSIYEYLNLHSNYYRLGQINKKIYEPKSVLLEDITDYVPKKEACLTDFVGLYTIIKNY